MATIDLEDQRKSVSRVSVDARDGSAWVSNYKLSVEHYSADGKSVAEHAVEAIAVQMDHAGDVGVVTPTEVQKMTAKGIVTKRVKHAGGTTQAWIASLE